MANSKRTMTTLHWFRRDLRLHDSPALHAAHRESGGRVTPVFVLSPRNAARQWSGPARQAALCESLAALSESLAARGSRLVLRRGDPVTELETLLRETRASTLTYHRSPDPAGRALEMRVESMARGLGVRVQTFDEVSALPPDAVLTQTGQPFRVFTPYARAWMRLLPTLAAPLSVPSRFAPPSGNAPLAPAAHTRRLGLRRLGPHAPAVH